VLILATLLVAGLAGAQQPTETLPGFRSAATYDSAQIDNVDLYGGDVGVVVPLGPEYPLGPNFSWRLSAFGTAKIWNFLDDACGPGQRALVHGKPTLGAGWTLDVGHFEGAGVGIGTYVSPDGGRHAGTPSTDGSRLRVTCQSSSSCTVEFPDGTKETFTQSYTIPRPSVGTSVDFDSAVPEVTTPTEVGLTSIVNRFGKTLLSVAYDATEHWKVSQITLEPGTAQVRTITYTWTTKTVAGVTWPVLSQVALPSAGVSGNPLTIVFAYDTAPITRNTFDQFPTAFGTCPASGTQANVPTLSSITFQDGAGVSQPILQTYSFTYQHTGANDDGAINHIGLPQGGTIDYTYDTKVMANHFVSPPTDLESSAADPPSFSPAAPPPPTPDISSCGDKRAAYLDSSIAVIKRVAKSSTTDTGIITQYARDEYDPADPCMVDGYTTVTRRVLVSEPDGDGTFHYVKYLFHVPDVVNEDPTLAGIELERRYYQDTNFGGTPVRTIVNCYEANAGTGPVCGYLANATTVQSYTITGQVRRQASVTWYGANPTGGGTCSGTTPACTKFSSTGYNTTALRYATTNLTSTLTPMTGWTQRTYSKVPTPNVTNWLLDLYSSATTSDNTGTPAPTGSTTTTSFNTTNGFLNSSYIDDTHGRVTTTFTPTNGDPTTITTTGTGGITGTFTDTCAYQSGLPISCTRSGFTWKSLDVTRENDTGAITTSRDPNGLATTYTYDAMNRVTKTTPPPGDDVTIRATRTCYLLATDNSTWNPSNLNFVWTKSGSTDGNTCLSNDGGALTFDATQQDGLGRPIREYRLLPNDLGSGSQFAIRDTAYDTAGHVISVSEWTPCNPSPNTGLINIGYCAVGLSSNNPAQRTTYTGFDAFDRPTTITKADGTSTTISYADGSITSSDSLQSVSVNVGGSTATTLTRTDALGRVIAVQEPVVLGVADTTSYQYSALDKIAGVTQGVQTRSFMLDARGWLFAETNPENGTTSYANYNALGNVGQRTEGSGADQVITTYTYDSAGRLLTISTNEKGGQTYVQNTYDTNPLGVSPDYTNGQLTQSIGWNFPLDPGPKVTAQLGFGGPGGRLSKRVTSIGSDSDVNDGAGVRDGESIAATENWTYSNLGLIDTYNHPRTSGTYAEDPSYVNGLPSATSANGTGVFSTVRYLPFGGLKSWTAQNSVVTTVGQATNLLPRPSSISTTGASSNFSTGTYSYDAAGNITAIGADTFKYDGRSRIVSADYGFGTSQCSDSLGNANRDQCFSYDRYGNLTGKSGANPQTLTTSTATNHLSGQTYDLRGNMVSGGAFDGLDRLRSSGGWIYLSDAGGERVAKFPDNPVLRREMAKLVIQARGEAKSATGCNTQSPFQDFYYDDVACTDPDRGWIDKANEDGIAQGFGNRTYGPANTVTRGAMAKFIVLARNEQPVDPGLCDPNNLTFSDVLCTDTFWGYIQQIYNDAITTGCGTDGGGHLIYCPSGTVPESQMMAFTRRGWNNFLYVPRGTTYTLRDAGGRIAAELMSMPGSTSYPTNDFPIATTATRDNVFLGNLLVGSYVSNSLGGATGWEYYHSDHLGTPRFTTSPTATTVETDKYFPYGDVATMTGTDQSQRLKFAAMERDSEATHFFDHARLQDSSLGRFISKDAFGGGVLFPQSLNRYSYVIGNPMRYIDPRGFDPDPNASSAEERSPDPQSEFMAVWGDLTEAELGITGLNDLRLGSIEFQEARSADGVPGKGGCNAFQRLLSHLPPLNLDADIPLVPFLAPGLFGGLHVGIGYDSTKDLVTYQIGGGLVALTSGRAETGASATTVSGSSEGAGFDRGINISGAAGLPSLGIGWAANEFIPFPDQGKPQLTGGPTAAVGLSGSLVYEGRGRHVAGLLPSGGCP
jgi:RHS repeat-associated protein